eukprot:5447107-Pleurochrysis_carterae.AAC.1
MTLPAHQVRSSKRKSLAGGWVDVSDIIVASYALLACCTACDTAWSAWAAAPTVSMRRAPAGDDIAIT